MHGCEYDVFECMCGTSEHRLILTIFPEFKTDPPDLFISIYLQKQSFWLRLWLGIKYIFGYMPKGGHFQEIMMNNEESKRLSDFLLKFCEQYNQFELKQNE